MGRPVVPERRDHARRNARPEGQRKGEPPHEHAGRKVLGEDVPHLAVAVLQRGAEIAPHDPAQGARILHVQRPVQAEPRGERPLDLRRQRAFGAERAARSQSHEPEGRRDQHEQDQRQSEGPARDERQQSHSDVIHMYLKL